VVIVGRALSQPGAHVEMTSDQVPSDENMTEHEVAASSSRRDPCIPSAPHPISPASAIPVSPSEFPSRRVVVLGASNVVRCISTVVETAQLVLDGPVDLLAAIGFGRSYGMTSRVLARSLPGIVDCGLWKDLSRRPPAQTFALLTDIGNDIVYGADVERIAGWVEQCLERLTPICERIVITELPLDSVSTLGPLRFHLFRACFFPTSRVSLQDASSRTQSLNSRVIDLAKHYGASVNVPKVEWYGFDPIHIRMRFWPGAWREILSAWRDDVRPPCAKGSFIRWLKLHLQRPQSRHMFGIHQQREQPTCAWRDGSMISLY